MDQWTFNPQSWNLYSYVRNNPLRLIDPTGNSAQDPCDKICQESRKKAEEARRKAEAEGIDTVVIDSKRPAVVEVVLVSEPLTLFEEYDERMTGDIGRDIWTFGEFAGIYDPTFYLMPGKSTATNFVLHARVGLSATAIKNIAETIGKGHAYTKHAKEFGPITKGAAPKYYRAHHDNGKRE